MNKLEIREYNTLVNKYNDIYKENKQLKDNYNLIDKSMSELIEENQLLKKQLKIKNDGFMASVEETCEYATILDELEKWIRDYIKLMDNNPDIIETGQIDILYEVLDKVKELKGDTKE